MMPLNFADPGKDYTIQRVGGTPAVKKHLEELGFVADGTVQVINTINGNLIVNVKETRVAISKEMAQKMNKDAIMFAMANPVPEIMPDLAKEGHHQRCKGPCQKGRSAWRPGRSHSPRLRTVDSQGRCGEDRSGIRSE